MRLKHYADYMNILTANVSKSIVKHILILKIQYSNDMTVYYAQESILSLEYMGKVRSNLFLIVILSYDDLATV